MEEGNEIPKVIKRDCNPQQKREAPLLWYHPDKVTESGKIDDLKDLHKVYVTISQGSASNAYVTRLGQQLVQGVKDYAELTLANNPESADFAVYVRLRPSVSTATEFGPTVSPTNDEDFFVVMRGAQRGEGVYVPRVIVRKRHVEGEFVQPAPILDLSVFIQDLKKIKGEK